MCEDAPCCGCCGQQSQSPEPVDHTPDPLHDAAAYDGGGWGGDGSGTDDLADMNANEVDDYRDEGNEDAGMDSYCESQTDLGD